MSGHSKWATIKHQKGAKDKARAKSFAKLIRQVEVAAREGGGDLDGNATLRTMFQKARAASVPIDTIERAIKRGTGELEGVRYEAITYEGYLPGGVAVLIETLSDNRNRTGSEVRSTLSKGGGSMAEPGAVAWQFQRRGVINIDKSANEDDLMLVAADAGAEDVVDQGDNWEVRCDPAGLEEVTTAIVDAGMKVTQSEAMMISQNLVPLASEAEARKVLNLIEALEEFDDVQNVWANFDIADDVLEAMAS